MKINKLTCIICGIVLAFILMIVSIFISTNNSVINYEEQIHEANASIEVQEKRRIDLVYNLVDTVKDYAKYEGKTLQQVIEARTNASSGNIEEAKLSINAIAEHYPDLKASEQYKQLMTELSITENLIAEQRNNYNIQIRSYNKFVRKFPSNIVLSIIGYEPVEFTYTEYNATSDAPQNLFDDK